MGQRAAIYARVSTVDQSCERQLRDLAAFAERGGFDVIATFAETASGTKDTAGSGAVSWSSRRRGGLTRCW